MTNVFFMPGTVGPETTFQDLANKDCFIITTGKGTVYMKVEQRDHALKKDVPWMLELMSGKIWPPTKSKVQQVEVEIAVHFEGK